MTERFAPYLTLLALSLPVSSHAQAVPQRVTIDSTPPGANVYIDGKDNGIACQSGPNCKPRLTRGSHRVIMEMEGYRSLDERVSISGPQRFAFTLRPVPAKLDVKTLATNSSALGGELFVDGALAGSVPSTVEIPAGKHMVEVRRPGFQSYSESVEVKGAETKAIYVTLISEGRTSPAGGTILVSSNPTAGEVFVDDQPRGPAPVLVENLAPGDHLVEVRTPDPHMPPWRRNVRVLPGQQAAAYAAFAPAPRQQPIQPQPAPPPLPMMPPPGPVLEPMAVVPRSSDMAYVVTTSGADSCTAPCTLLVPAGPTVLNVRGPGSKAFQREIIVPRGPSQVTVQHFTKSRAIAGTVLLVLGLPLAVIGGWALAEFASQYDPDVEGITGAGFVAAHGFAFTVAGIEQLATVHGNRAEVVSLAPRLAANLAEPPPFSERSPALAVSPLLALSF